MRILLITHFFPPQSNYGTENYTLGLARLFQARGHQVHVVCAGDWNAGQAYWNGSTHDTITGVPVYRLNLNWPRAKDPNRVLYTSETVDDWLSRHLRQHPVDVVHVTSTYSLGVGVLTVVKQAGLPLILTLMDFWFICPRTTLIDGDDQLCDGCKSAVECQTCLHKFSSHHPHLSRVFSPQAHEKMWDFVVQHARLRRLRGARGLALDMEDRKQRLAESLELPDRIFSHSKFVQRMFAETNVCHRVEHLLNGQDLNWLPNYQGKSDSPMLRLGYIGQIQPLKGVHLLVEAFRQAGIEDQARLIVWGDLEKEPVYTEHLRTLAQGSDNIEFRGRFNHDEIDTVLSEIDVLVVPSLWYENAPLVIQEAYATGTPVIATDLGGMAEFVHHEQTGLLFKRNSVPDLMRQLYRIVNENGLLARLRDQLRAVKTTVEEIAELEVIYQELISNKSTPLKDSAVELEPKVIS